MTECVHCGGSGVLNIEMSMRFPSVDGEWDMQAYASACHACEVGRMWSKDLSLD